MHRTKIFSSYNYIRVTYIKLWWILELFMSLIFIEKKIELSDFYAFKIMSQIFYKKISNYKIFFAY